MWLRRMDGDKAGIPKQTCTAGVISLEAGPGLALLVAGKVTLPVGYGIYEQCGPGCGIGGYSTLVLRAELQPPHVAPWALD